MAKGIKICKVCGAEYEYCRTKYRDTNMFRWQDVACCAEHGSEYFAAILTSRSEQRASNNEKIEAPSVLEVTVPADNDEETVSTNETITDTPEIDGDSDELFIDEDGSSEIDI